MSLLRLVCRAELFLCSNSKWPQFYGILVEMSDWKIVIFHFRCNMIEFVVPNELVPKTKSQLFDSEMCESDLEDKGLMQLLKIAAGCL